MNNAEFGSLCSQAMFMPNFLPAPSGRGAVSDAEKRLARSAENTIIHYSLFIIHYSLFIKKT